jgi:hypothetical protein
MSTLTVTISSPAPQSTVSARTFTVRGTVTLRTTGGRTREGNIRVFVTFGVNGPTVAATVTGNATWECTGAPHAGVAPNSVINVTATAEATLRFFVGRSHV